MKHWRIMDYYSDRGTNLIREWYLKQEEDVQADFDAILNILAAVQDWNGRKDCLPLLRRHRPLWEIRFTVKSVKYRPVGFFGPKKGEFTLLLGCKKEKRGDYSPRNAFDEALKLWRRFVEDGKGRTNEHY